MNVPNDVVISMAMNGVDKEEIIRNLIILYPQIFFELVVLDDLLVECRKAYVTQNGNSKIAAIKRYRELTGTGLKIAVAAINKYIDEGFLPK